MLQKTAKVAFIIQCHKNPEQIHLLTDGLKKIFDCRIFLHVDKKSAQIRPALDTDRHTLVPEEKSIDVRWGKFSQCEATLELIEAVLSSEEKFDYICLISGQDLPIVSREDAARLLPEPPIPFIQVIGPDDPMHRYYAKRNDVFCPEWMIQRTLFARILRRLYLIMTGGRGYTFPIFRRKWDIPYYFGSSWWCLPYNCVGEMMEILKSNQEYIDYFKHAVNPDESLFQTLFMQTSYAGQQKNILTYVDWSQGKSSPRTFTADQWEVLVAAKKNYAFARKFDYSLDQAVCHRVMTELCGLSPEEE